MPQTPASPERSSTSRRRIVAAFAALALAATFAPARAARPLPDKGKWDRTFALYARDVNVPWKRITVRLDTYSGAPVDFAAYEVDPADVLVAGGSRPRAVDTSRRKAVARWRFTPPPGLRYTPSDVEVPLQNRQGFYVIEARRGDAVQQTWIDLTRIGLLTKESPGGIVLYGADLGTGKSLGGMRVTLLVGTRLVTQKTDAHGILRWTGGQRPRFALAEWGQSKTFVSLLPQPPVPAAVVGVRTDRANVRAGEPLHVVGFARKRNRAEYRPAKGEAQVRLIQRGRTLAQATATLDGAGAFSAQLAIPAGAPVGDAAVVAIAAGASGGAAIRIESLGDVALDIAASCSAACPADQPLSATVTATTAGGTPAAGRDVRVQIVRSPHVLPPGASEETPGWATTTIVDARVRTGATGTAAVAIPAPSDGLPSTYGITATSGGASASTRIVAPTARVALAIVPARAQIDVTDSAVFAVRGFDALDGRPAAGLAVRVRLVHGPTVQEQRVTLDSDGRAQAVFRDVVPGTNLAEARADVDGKTAIDVGAITVAPQALLGARVRRSAEVRIATDKARYRVGDRITVDASLAGAVGDAFVSFEGVRPLGDVAVPTNAGRASAQLVVPETVGDASAGVAFVRDGALEFGTRRIVVDGPGHARITTLHADRSTYQPGALARFTISDGNERSGATLAIRVSDAPATSGAGFRDAPNVLDPGGTTTQDPTSDDPAWHGSVAPSRSTALDDGASGAGAARSGPVLGAVAMRRVLWRVDRGSGEQFELALPRDPGRYVVSVLKIADDGDVGAASLALEVR